MKEFKWETYLSFRTTAAGNNRSIHVETLSTGVSCRDLHRGSHWMPSQYPSRDELIQDYVEENSRISNTSMNSLDRLHDINQISIDLSSKKQNN